MNNLIFNFEEELKLKLEQKCGSYSNIDTSLIKFFKYFDLKNLGSINKLEFEKTIDKIGMSCKKKQIDSIFNHYDKNNSGAINYKEFTYDLLYDRSSISKSEISNNNEEKLVKDLFYKLSSDIKNKGILGIFTFGRLFRINDENNTRFTDYKHFLKVIRGFSENFDKNHIKTCFKFFDRDMMGLVNYDEILIAIRGPMPKNRIKLVNKLFNSLPLDSENFASINDLKNIFKPQNHPDFINKKFRVEKISCEFVQSVEYFYDIKGFMDGKISLDEFLEFYSFISFYYENNDKEFETILRNCWTFDDKISYTTYSKHNNSKESKNNSHINKKSESQKLNNNYIDKSILSNKDSIISNNTKKSLNSNISRSIKSRHIKSNISEVDNNENKNFKKHKKVNIEENNNEYLPYFLKFIKDKLSKRGIRSYLALKKQFHIMDDDNDGYLDFPEFTKCLKDFKIYLNDSDYKIIFKELRIKELNKININEFFEIIIPDLNKNRMDLIELVYEKLMSKVFKGNNLTIQDIKMNYSSKNHIDFKNGLKCENEILAEFIDSLDLYCSLYKVKIYNFKKEDLIQYFKIYSATIEKDKLFNWLIKGTWRLFKENSREEKIQPAWRQPNLEQIKINRQKLIAPYGVSNEKYVNETSNRKNYYPKKNFKNISDLYDKGIAAGINTWPNYEPVNYSNNEDNEALVIEILNEIRNILVSKGPKGFIYFYKSFFNMDENKNKMINYYEFSEVMKFLRLDLNENHKELLFNTFDMNKNKTINYEQFYLALRGYMSKERINFLKGVFDTLTENKENIDIMKLKELFNSKKHPNCLSKIQSPEEVYIEFLDWFEDHHFLFHLDYKMKKTEVFFEEFLSFYEMVSATIEDDNNFYNYLKNIWLKTDSSIRTERSINRSRISRSRKNI